MLSLSSSTFGLVDSEETCFVVMVYNTANSWGALIGDTVVIPEPNVKRHSITHKEKVSISCMSFSVFTTFVYVSNFSVSSQQQSFDFKSIRVDSPLLLIVNGKKQNIQSQIPVSVSYKTQSEWIHRQEKGPNCLIFLLDLLEFSPFLLSKVCVRLTGLLFYFYLIIFYCCTVQHGFVL